MPHTPDSFQAALNVAKAMGRLSAIAADSANKLQRQVSEANIAAETAQADLALRQERSRLAQAFAEHTGTLAVNAAFRGSAIGDASTQASITSAAFRASNEVAVAEANRAATVLAIRARNIFVEEDVNLAAIEGGFRGLNIGLSIASALEEMTTVRQRRSTKILAGDPGTFGFAEITEDIAFTPGLDFSNFDLGSLGINLGF